MSLRETSAGYIWRATLGNFLSELVALFNIQPGERKKMGWGEWQSIWEHFQNLTHSNNVDNWNITVVSQKRQVSIYVLEKNALVELIDSVCLFK